MGVNRRFDRRTVLITGGAHGIGFATARLFAEAGASVFLMDRDSQTLTDATTSLGRMNPGRVGTYAGDVCLREDIEAALGACEQSFGPVDVLLANAGYSRSKHVLRVTEQEWDEVVGVCLTGVFRTAQTVARSMVARARGGVILTACATSAVASEPGLSSYAAAKSGVLALTRAMATELAPHQIRVCTVLPGETATHPWPNLELQRIYEGRIAAGRSAYPAEVAATYLYLASEDAFRLNGCALVVDGGMLAWE